MLAPVAAAAIDLNDELDKFWNSGRETSDGQIKRICAAQKRCQSAIAAMSQGAPTDQPDECPPSLKQVWPGGEAEVAAFKAGTWEEQADDQPDIERLIRAHTGCNFGESAKLEEELRPYLRQPVRESSELIEAAKALCETHGNIAFAVGSGMNPRNADWGNADDVLARCRKAIADAEGGKAKP